MKSYGYFLLMSIISQLAFSAAPTQDDYWLCVTQDKTTKEWGAKSPYQKVAINVSFDACKKESTIPATCKSSKTSCERFVQGMSTSPRWSCTALDLTAVAWPSNFYLQRIDAALAAKDFCKDNSTVPDSCYINLVTCRNINEGIEL
jgi:hypothetical protein